MQTIQRDTPERAVQEQSGIPAIGKAPQTRSQDDFAAYFSQTQRGHDVAVKNQNRFASGVVRSGVEGVGTHAEIKGEAVPKPAESSDSEPSNTPYPPSPTEVNEQTHPKIGQRSAAAQATSDPAKSVAVDSDTPDDTSTKAVTAGLGASSAYLIVTSQAKSSTAGTKPFAVSRSTSPKGAEHLHKSGPLEKKNLDASVATSPVEGSVIASSTSFALPIPVPKETAKSPTGNEQTAGKMMMVIKAAVRDVPALPLAIQDSPTLPGAVAPALDTGAASEAGTPVTRAPPIKTSSAGTAISSLTQANGERVVDARLSMPTMFHSQLLQPGPGVFVSNTGTTEQSYAGLRAPLSAVAELQGTFSEIGSNRHQLEVGFHDDTLGWLSVRTALGDQGTLHASVAGTNRIATHALGEMLPGLDGYLRQHAVELTSLSVAKPESGRADQPESSTGVAGTLDGGGNTGSRQQHTAREAPLPNEPEPQPAIGKFTQPLRHDEKAARPARAGARVDIRI